MHIVKMSFFFESRSARDTHFNIFISRPYFDFQSSKHRSDSRKYVFSYIKVFFLPLLSPAREFYSHILCEISFFCFFAGMYHINKVIVSKNEKNVVPSFLSYYVELTFTTFLRIMTVVGKVTLQTTVHM